MECSPSGIIHFSLRPAEGCKSSQQTCSSMRYLIFPTFQEPSPAWIAHEVIASFRADWPAPVWSCLQAAGGSPLPCKSPWAAGAQLPHHGLQGNLCSGAWSTSFFFPYVAFCRVLSLTYFQSSLQLLLPNVFFLLKCVILEAVLLSLGHRESVLESAANGSIRHGGVCGIFSSPQDTLGVPLTTSNLFTIHIRLEKKPTDFCTVNDILFFQLF